MPNAKGKLTKVTTGTGATPQAVTEYQEFDILGRVKRSQQWVEGTAYGSPMTYTYNLSGALIEQTYPSGRVVKNTLDNNADLAQVESKKNAGDFFRLYAGSFVYNAAGAVASMRLGNGKFENTVFNSRLQPTQIALGVTPNATNLLKLDYFYGTMQNNGNVLSQTITVPTVGINNGFAATQTYNYDSLNRLKDTTESVTPNGGSAAQSWKQTFVYDRYGNRNFDRANTTQPASFANPNITDPAVNASNNRLAGGQGYSYDNAGNTTADAEGRTFIYDAENKQVKVTEGAMVIGEYIYDGDGKRIKKIVPSTGEVTVFVYS